MNNSEQQVIIRYWSGAAAHVGDIVVIDETQRSVVREVVETPEKMRALALDEYGLMFDGVFYPERFLREYCVDLVSRAGA
jgi:hypothetical protein